jgi:hypothetical protein
MEFHRVAPVGNFPASLLGDIHADEGEHAIRGLPFAPD